MSRPGKDNAEIRAFLSRVRHVLMVAISSAIGMVLTQMGVIPSPLTSFMGYFTENQKTVKIATTSNTSIATKSNGKAERLFSRAAFISTKSASI